MGEVAHQRHVSEPSAVPLSGSSAGAAAVRRPFIAADVGGTHARIALVIDGAIGKAPIEVLHYHRYSCGEWPNLVVMLQDFVAQLATTPHAAAARQIERCVLACAGCVLDDAIINENLPWPVPIAPLRHGLGIAQLAVINDFEAAAYAAQFIDAVACRSIIDAPQSQAQAQAPTLVLGPGTGLGAAVLLPGRPRAHVLPTEAGLVALAPGNEREIAIVRVLQRERAYVAYQDVLSGPGLRRLYRVLCELRGSEPVLQTPAQISAAASCATDAAALESLHVFCGLLGSFVGDLVLLYRASAVYLAGGILPQIQPFLQASRFAERYFNKGVMRAYLQHVPVRLIEHGQLGVIGAASWFLDIKHVEQAT